MYAGSVLLPTVRGLLKALILSASRAEWQAEDAESVPERLGEPGGRGAEPGPGEPGTVPLHEGRDDDLGHDAVAP